MTSRALWQGNQLGEAEQAEGTDVHADPVPMFSSLRIRNYRLYLFGQLISVAGNWMQNVAIGWAVLQLSHSGTVLGLVTGARFAPLLLLGPWGGLVADRLDNRRLMMCTQACAAGLSSVLAMLAWNDLISLPALVGLVVSLGLVNVFDGPSRQTLIGQLVDRRHLGNAIALNSTGMNCARVFGPGVAGALIATIGVTPCFFVNALSFVAVIVSLLAMNRADLIPAQREARAKGQIMAGVRHVRHKPELLFPLIMIAVTGIFTWEFPITLPLLTTQTFHQGATAYGTAVSCLGIGSVCGGLIAARRRNLTVRALAISSVLWGATIMAASLAPVLPVAFVVLALVGSGAITFNSAAKTLLQLSSAPHMRGRVMSLWSIAWQGGTVIGAPIVGVIGADLGARYALQIGGVAAIAVGAVVLALRVETTTVVEPTGVTVDIPEN